MNKSFVKFLIATGWRSC